ncbi:50S ribosomal protein L13 [Stratiformator vulcanicus]|nr:50S ribosomal protein L13 [Stratiformator vulcanicus]
MPSLQKSHMANESTVEPNWFVIDADGQIVGRLATRIATVLMGKHKPEYTPHCLTGDFVIVTNVERVKFGGKQMDHPELPYYSKKWDMKSYDTYSGYPGGRKVKTALETWQRRPEMILHEAVRRMLPKNKLGRQMMKRLKLHVGGEHDHQAQQPEAFPDHI